MKQDPMIVVNVYLRRQQRSELMAISTDDVTFAEHVRRAVDNYLSIPEQQAALKRRGPGRAGSAT